MNTGAIKENFGWKEKLLLCFCEDPQKHVRNINLESWNTETALGTLEELYPDFLSRVQGKRVLDFGCGLGYQAIALSSKGCARIVGLDNNLEVLEEARKLAEENQCGDNVVFLEKLEDEDLKSFDVVISQNSMEHFPEPLETLKLMKDCLNDRGEILMTFGPPWYSPQGSHMNYFTRLPWVNLLFPEETVMKVRQLYRSDGATRYEEVSSGLNKMTIRKFETLVDQAGLRVGEKKYDCIKKMNFLSSIPGLKELFINRVTCVLREKSVA